VNRHKEEDRICMVRPTPSSDSVLMGRQMVRQLEKTYLFRDAFFEGPFGKNLRQREATLGGN
jgi:hypothetical protein